MIAANRAVDAETAKGIASMFVECVVAPGFTSEALDVLTAKKGIRLLALPGEWDGGGGRQTGIRLNRWRREWWVSADEGLRSGARFLARAGGTRRGAVVPVGIWGRAVSVVAGSAVLRGGGFRVEGCDGGAGPPRRSGMTCRSRGRPWPA